MNGEDENDVYDESYDKDVEDEQEEAGCFIDVSLVLSDPYALKFFLPPAPAPCPRRFRPVRLPNGLASCYRGCVLRYADALLDAVRDAMSLNPALRRRVATSLDVPALARADKSLAVKAVQVAVEAGMPAAGRLQRRVGVVSVPVRRPDGDVALVAVPTEDTFAPKIAAAAAHESLERFVLADEAHADRLHLVADRRRVLSHWVVRRFIALDGRRSLVGQHGVFAALLRWYGPVRRVLLPTVASILQLTVLVGWRPGGSEPRGGRVARIVLAAMQSLLCMAVTGGLAVRIAPAVLVGVEKRLGLGEAARGDDAGDGGVEHGSGRESGSGSGGGGGNGGEAKQHRDHDRVGCGGGGVPANGTHKQQNHHHVHDPPSVRSSTPSPPPPPPTRHQSSSSSSSPLDNLPSRYHRLRQSVPWFHLRLLLGYLRSVSFMWTVLLAISSVGAVWWPPLAVLAIFDALLRTSLYAVFSSLFRARRRIAALFVLLFVVMWVFSLVAVQALRNDFDPGVGMHCTTPAACLLSLWHVGLAQQGAVWEFLSPVREDSVGRVAFDVAFFLCIGVILLNLIFASLVDAFGEERERRQMLRRLRAHECVVCGVPRDVLSDRFAHHVDRVHSPEMYVYLYRYLVGKLRGSAKLSSVEQAVVHAMEQGQFEDVLPVFHRDDLDDLVDQ